MGNRGYSPTYGGCFTPFMPTHLVSFLDMNSQVSSGSQALQGWLVALRDRYDLAGLDGDYRGMEEVYGTLEPVNCFLEELESLYIHGWLLAVSMLKEFEIEYLL